jgi:hypothetical protein
MTDYGGKSKMDEPEQIEEEPISEEAVEVKPEKISFKDLEITDEPVREEPKESKENAFLTDKATFEGIITEQKKDIAKAKKKIKEKEKAVKRVEEATKGSPIVKVAEALQVAVKVAKEIQKTQIPEIPEIPEIKQEAHLKEQTSEIDRAIGGKKCPLCKSELIINTKVKQEGLGLNAIITTICPRRRFFRKIFRRYCDYRKKETVKIE